jgi:hypothetical protein
MIGVSSVSWCSYVKFVWVDPHFPLVTWICASVGAQIVKFHAPRDSTTIYNQVSVQTWRDLPCSGKMNRSKLTLGSHFTISRQSTGHSRLMGSRCKRIQGRRVSSRRQKTVTEGRAPGFPCIGEINASGQTDSVKRTWYEGKRAGNSNPKGLSERQKDEKSTATKVALKVISRQMRCP